MFNVIFCLFSVPQILGSYGSCWGQSFRIYLMQFSFAGVVFQSFSIQRHPFGWSTEPGVYLLGLILWRGHIWAAQKSKLIVPEHTWCICGQSCSVPCWSPGCGLIWVLGEGSGGFSCWLEMKGLIKRQGHRNCLSLCLRFSFLNSYLENEDDIS